MSKSPPTITESESTYILADLMNHNGTAKQKQRGLRNYLMCLIMLDAGLRVGEVVQLRIDNLFLCSEPVNSIVIPASVTKNNEARSIPTSERLRFAIKSMHCNVWEPKGWLPSDFAFVNLSTGKCLTTRQVERFLSAVSMSSIGRSIHPHILRHTFASRLMRTVNIRIVQELLGHKEVTTTQIYTHPNEDDKRKAIESIAVNKPVKSS